MIVKMIKKLENNVRMEKTIEKMQESINKDIQELKNKHKEQTTQLLKLKILYFYWGNAD